MSSRSRTNGADNRPTPPNIETMHSLKVDNLTFRTRAEDLRKYFEKFGAIGDIYIPRDQFSRSSRGYAFVRFLKKRDAEDALDRMDGAEIDGREVRVQFARYGRASNIDGRDRSRRHRTRSRSRSPRRSKHRSRSRSNQRSRSRTPSDSKRVSRHDNDERDHRH